MVSNISGLVRQFAAVTLLAMVGCQAVAAQEGGGVSSEVVENPYQINPGDRLAITVWKEPDLQRQVIVRPDGAFSFPLAGDILAQGRSIEQIRLVLEEKLSRYIPDLVVTVSAEEIAGNRVFVIGQVQRPGAFTVNANIDVTQALSIAGGMNAFAKTNDIKILRRVDGKLTSIRFRYGDIEAGKRLEQNVLLQAGDVIVVP